MALCRAHALRRLAGGTSTVMNVPAQGQTRLVIVGAMGMVHRFAKLRVPRPRATGIRTGDIAGTLNKNAPPRS